MSNPYGNYTFAGLGFASLYFPLEDTGSLSPAQGNILISNKTYTDATGVVTFSAGQSPAGVTDLNFTGNIILDLSGNVTAIAGTWTGRSHLNVAAKPAFPRQALTPSLRSTGLVRFPSCRLMDRGRRSAARTSTISFRCCRRPTLGARDASRVPLQRA